MEMIEFYLNKIKKVIALDDIETVNLKQILEEFYSEAVRSDHRTEAWMEGYKEGRNHREEED
jgi:hypothetical protein